MTGDGMPDPMPSEDLPPTDCARYTRPMLRHILAPMLAVGATLHGSAQFTLQHSGTNASLRGIDTVSGNIAWASGSQGTVLRTLDGGVHWTRCATPPAAEQLDFRGIQAFDTQTAFVMSSGKGDLSRVYRTSDGCATWKLLFTNPDAPNGFFDAVQFTRPAEGWILGDPVNGHFFLATTQDAGETWLQSKADGLKAASQSGAFAASNQSLVLSSSGPMFGGGGGQLFRGMWPQCSQSTSYNDPAQCLDRIWFNPAAGLGGAESPTSGIFAIAEQDRTVIAVGGDYAVPQSTLHTAAFSTDEGVTWKESAVPPHGYRSSVAYHQGLKTWITVGPNGTDISTNGGRTWSPLTPDHAKGDAAGADRQWNAISLPFVVGPEGRIGTLRKDAISATAQVQDNVAR